tara:strand:- start:357 stop:1274 length:918 start_codon:yes stop_codon:yes gene_type:complete
MGLPKTSTNDELDLQEILRFIIEKERLTKTLRHFDMTKDQLKALFSEASDTPSSSEEKEEDSVESKSTKKKTSSTKRSTAKTSEAKSSKTTKSKSSTTSAKSVQKDKKTTKTTTAKSTASKEKPASKEKDKDKEKDKEKESTSKSSTTRKSRRQSSPRGRRSAVFEPENYTYNRLLIYSDGAARGNPGESGAGVVLKTPEGEEVGRFGKYLGRKTNNYAEYQAVLLGLRHAREFGANEITILSDSELLVRQLLGEYRVRASHLRELFDEVKELLTLFEKYQIKRVNREKNAEADSMANRAIDEKL